MNEGKLNSLVELYFKSVKEIDGKKLFLQWLKPENTREYFCKMLLKKY